MDIESAGVYQLLLETPTENVLPVAAALSTVVELDDGEFKKVVQDMYNIRFSAEQGERAGLIHEAAHHALAERGASASANQEPLFAMTA